MGQLVAVTEKPSSTPGIVRFETNRTFSGMGHERFRSVADAYGATPSDELARRLFATGQVGAVHVMANIVTVDLLKGHAPTGSPTWCAICTSTGSPAWSRRCSTTRPPTKPMPRAPAGDAGGDGGGDAALSEAAKRVPMHLLERSRAARDRWAAKSA